MKKYLLILLLLILVVLSKLTGQSHYVVAPTAFSSPEDDEFSPVIYLDQIVFCSNMDHVFLISYKNQENKGLFNICKVSKNQEADSPKAEVFSPNLVTPFNDGPASFSPDSKLVVYSRNIDIKKKTKNIFDPENKLGLYFAELIEGEWTPAGKFPFNNPDYSITTPCFSRDGKYLYFGSDMPGGYGGTDIYRSERSDSTWSTPVNLGEPVNTSGNEVYPFVAMNGDLFFASDGHGGPGKKDILITRMSGSDWITPVLLDAPINSTEDDFGLITNRDFSEGYFSTSRGTSDDIYRFTTLLPQLYDCDTLQYNQYCFEFWDDAYIGGDSLPVTYEWEFSDGEKIRGLKVEHCLPGAGKYWARLNIIDNTTSTTFFTQTSMEFELEDHVQAYITSREAGIINKAMKFSGLSSNLPDYSIEEYLWDFGDGSLETGPEVEHQFEMTGLHEVKLGLTGYAEGSDQKETRCVVKTITLLEDNQALAMHSSGIKPFEVAKLEKPESKDSYVNSEELIFRIEVIASNEKVMLEDTLFDALRDTYEIKEFYLSDANLYSYTVGEYNSLLAGLEDFHDLVDKGYSSARVKTYILADIPSEIIANINRDFAEVADAYFEFNQAEVSEQSYPLLDQVVKIMCENPDLTLEIAAHTDDVGSEKFNMELSGERAQSIVDYLVSRGIDRTRLEGIGYGESRPISTNSTEEEKMKNRRVEFLILKK